MYKLPCPCVKASVCTIFCVYKLLCAEACCVQGVACFGTEILVWASFGPEKSWGDLRVRCAELRWGETSWQHLRSAEEVWEERRRCEKRKRRWEGIRWADMSCGELRRIEKSCENLRKPEISWGEMRRDEKSSGDMRREENSCDQPRRAEQGREELRWDKMRWKKLTRREMRWVEMRWDDTDCGDNGMAWAISKRSCDAMRSDEMRIDSTFKKHEATLTSQELVAAKHRRLARHL